MLRLAMSAMTSVGFPIVLYKVYGVQAAGHWFGLTAIFGLIAFAEAGMTTSLSRLAPPRYGTDLGAWRAGSWAILTAATGSAGVGATLLIYQQPNTLRMSAVLVGCLTTLSILIGCPGTAALVAAHEARLLYKINAWYAGARAVALIAPPLVGCSPAWIAVSYLGAFIFYLASLGWALSLCRLDSRIYLPGGTPSEVWRLARYGLTASSGTAADLSFYYVNRLTLLYLGGANTAGVYGIISSMAQALQQVGATFSQYLMSFAVRHAREPRSAQTARSLSCAANDAVILPTVGAVLAVVLSGPISETLLRTHGATPPHAALALSLLVCAVYLISMTTPFAIVLLSRGDAREFAIATGASALINGAGSVIAAPYGIIPVAATNLAASVGMTVLFLRIARTPLDRRILLRPFAQLRYCLPLLVATPWMPGLVWAASPLQLATVGCVLVVGAFMTGWMYQISRRQRFHGQQELQVGTGSRDF